MSKLFGDQGSGIRDQESGFSYRDSTIGNWLALITSKNYRRWTRLVVGLGCAVALVGCGADTAADFNQRGNDLYEQGIYGQALPQYKEAVALAPDHPAPNNNLGNTRYQLGDYLGSIESSKDALKNADPQTQAIIYYNQGNAHFRMNQLDQAIDAYKEALRRVPDDLDTKYNLELAQKTQEQQQQQQQANGQGPQPQDQPPQQPGQGQQPPEQPGQGQQPPQQPQDGGAGGQDQRPDPPPSSLSPEEAERQLDQLRRSEERNNEDLYDNYAVGGGDENDPNNTGPGDSGW